MYPRTEPFACGWLDRPDGARLHWETTGAPNGIPAIFLHGGPGGGLGLGGYRRRFDPERYLLVGLDQRGCGASTPWAVDDLEHLDRNTTDALIGDIEAVRIHLGLDSVLVHGVSWGTTLALAYALAHPRRTSALVLAAVTTGSREEIDWITRDIGRVFPEEWSALAAPVPPGDRLIEWYASRLRDPDPAIRAAAADAWDRWESTHVSLDPAWRPGPTRADGRDRRNFATLVTHYWASDCFLPADRAILSRADELAGIPGVLIHGRRDISGPAATPWLLHRRWPGSRLAIVEGEGHGGAHMMQLVADATDAFADRLS